MNPAALGAAVALITAEIGGVRVDRGVLLDGVDQGEVIAALVWVAGSLLRQRMTERDAERSLQDLGQWAVARGSRGAP